MSIKNTTKSMGKIYYWNWILKDYWTNGIWSVSKNFEKREEIIVELINYNKEYYKTFKNSLDLYLLYSKINQWLLSLIRIRKTS